jgi:GntR family transcriptional regulator, transcriptional repressor for pyruvate dehydrogenase complex
MMITMVRPTSTAPPTIIPSRQIARPNTMPELLAHQIADDILSHELDGPAFLPSERELKDAYGVSRGTLREALRILESYGVLTIRRGSNGGVVQPFRPDSMVRSLSFLLKLGGVSLSEVIEARLALEPLIVAQTAAHASKEEIQELEDMVDRIDDELDDQTSSLFHGREFHEALGRMSRNKILACFAATLSSISDGHSAGVDYSPARLRGINASHRRLVEALKRHDSIAAGDEAKRHLVEFRQHLQKNFPDLLDGPVRWMLADETSAAT